MFCLHLKQTIHNEGFKVCEYGFHFQINSIWVYIIIRLGLVMGLMQIVWNYFQKWTFGLQIHLELHYDYIGV